MTLVQNSTPVQQVFGRINRRFDKLYEKRAFMSHFNMSNTDDMELEMAKTDLGSLSELYGQIRKERAAIHANPRISMNWQPEENKTEDD